MRTRQNGEELTAAGLAEDIIAFGDEMADDGHSVAARELGRDLYEVVLRAEQRATSVGFADGMQLGAKIEHRVAVEAIATAALHVLGKDIGDGEIKLGALGSWWPSFETAIGPKGQEGGSR
jgi:hypothetical protein